MFRILCVFLIFCIVLVADNLNKDNKKNKIYVQNEYISEKSKIDDFKKQCDNNGRESCVWLAGYYLYGKDNVKQNVQKGLELYNKACNLDFKEACEALHTIYFDGKNELNIKKDFNKSFYYLVKICKLESKKCPNFKPNKDFKNYINACDKDFGWACYYVAISKNDINLYEKACILNEIKACFDLGSMYESGNGLPQNISKAKKYFKIVCDKDDSYIVCSENRDAIYGSKDGVSANFTQKMQVAMEKCAKNNAMECFNLGTYYYNGDNVTKDFQKAKENFKKSCDLGYKTACEAYNDM
ncbi:tetratricopeptide repeat protein [Helicobacter saguini]|nr:tetratricopeptide repeat protein [Helicobacter saguini]